MLRWILCAAGAFLIVTGLVSKTLISESDVVASDEDGQSAKASILKRIIVVGAGVASLGYGLHLIVG